VTDQQRIDMRLQDVSEQYEMLASHLWKMEARVDQLQGQQALQEGRVEPRLEGPVLSLLAGEATPGTETPAAPVPHEPPVFDLETFYVEVLEEVGEHARKGGTACGAVFCADRALPSSSRATTEVPRSSRSWVVSKSGHTRPLSSRVMLPDSAPPPGPVNSSSLRPLGHQLGSHLVGCFPQFWRCMAIRVRADL
jgi:hypothetical protein